MGRGKERIRDDGRYESVFNVNITKIQYKHACEYHKDFSIIWKILIYPPCFSEFNIADLETLATLFNLLFIFQLLFKSMLFWE